MLYFSVQHMGQEWGRNEQLAAEISIPIILSSENGCLTLLDLLIIITLLTHVSALSQAMRMCAYVWCIGSRYSLITWGWSKPLSLSHSSKKLSTVLSPPSASLSNWWIFFTATDSPPSCPSCTAPYAPLFNSRPILKFAGGVGKESISINFLSCAIIKYRSSYPYMTSTRAGMANKLCS